MTGQNWVSVRLASGFRLYVSLDKITPVTRWNVYVKFLPGFGLRTSCEHPDHGGVDVVCRCVSIAVTKFATYRVGQIANLL